LSCIRNSYTLTTIYAEHASGRNWVECYRKLDHAVFDLLEQFEEYGEPYIRGEYDEEEDEFDNTNLVFDGDADVVFDSEQAHKYIGHSWDFGDYTITLSKV
jgi:hypothetical protein